MTQYLDDIGRVLTPVVFTFMVIRWGSTVRWWVYWDTRALFLLFIDIVLISWYSVAVAARWLPTGSQWVGAIVWGVLAVTGLFLVVGYEVERHRARHRKDQPTA